MKGTCKICNKKIMDGNYAEHLHECVDTERDNVNDNNFYLLHIQDADIEGYWMFVGCVCSTTLEELDVFLREKWVDCCGHMSEYTKSKSGKIIGMKTTMDQVYQQTYPIVDSKKSTKSAKSTKSNVMMEIEPIRYDYDFGSPTTLFITILQKYEKCIFDDKIFLLMENDPILFKCKKCRKRSTQICDSCIIKLCVNCSKKHECPESDEAIIYDLYNSPRIGVCGYFGPS